ncbi:hypothetical protein GPECTOR_27g716 [Gonium pectorale]|uniref:PKD/Chitinase domain-containing protein n=1 Tax=Gonium pectorale TaxID=33097 RepID=A0A150GG18_GONPE|nr:hypothetical protein GPECTOR_27g716 [Gonium pectorale]|eukprot:KXZ48545.1 hypothetical protein GPECTOR_27g716 [Gonium pectorale]
MQWGFVSNTSWAVGHPMQSWFPRGALVLSSGDASAGNCGANTLDYYTLSVGGGGDADLNQLIPFYTTYDAAVLEFDVTAHKDGLLVFKYAFGSDEYTEWVGTAFNDVFGFFISPAGQSLSSTHNVALVKGTETQVSINNVNGASNQAMWNNNRKIEVGSNVKALEADGYTNLLNTKGYQVYANQTYHFKLAIADAGDRILDSWVWIGGETLLVDQQPVANDTNPTPNCATKVVTLDGTASYDPDKDDVLTYKWRLAAPCLPPVEASGVVAQVDLSKLADGATYSVTLTVTDDNDVEATKVSTLTVPTGCGAAVASTCGGGGGSGVAESPPPPSAYPGDSSSGSTTTGGEPPPSPPPPPKGFVDGAYTAGGAAVVPCGGAVTLTAGPADDAGLAELALNYDGATAGYPVYYIWQVYDILDPSYDAPIASQTLNAVTEVTFTADDLKQGRMLKKYRVLLDVTDVPVWDAGNGLVSEVVTFLQVLACPIQPANPPEVVTFDGASSPDAFTLACGAAVSLDAGAPFAAAAAKKNTTGSQSRILRWRIVTSDATTGTVVWGYDHSIPLGSTKFVSTVYGSALVDGGAIVAGEVYGIQLAVVIDGEEVDDDNWQTRISVESLTTQPQATQPQAAKPQAAQPHTTGLQAAQPNAYEPQATRASAIKS